MTSSDSVDFAFAEQLGLDSVEWSRIVERLGRQPNEIECRIFAALWSEEVSQKSTSALLQTIYRTSTGVLSMQSHRLGAVAVDEEHFALCRSFSRNRQVNQEPTSAALVCLSTLLADVTGVGAQPLGFEVTQGLGAFDQGRAQLMFAELSTGLSQFTRQTGIPCLGSSFFFHRAYNTSSILSASMIALADRKVWEQRVPAQPGHLVVLIGTETGKDGLLASEKQVGFLGRKNTVPLSADPAFGWNLQRVFAELYQQNILSASRAVGLGGLAVAAIDLANEISASLRINLNYVPARSATLDAASILLSETPSRFLCTVPREKQNALSSTLGRHRLAAVVLGEVVLAEGVLFEWNRHLVADVPYRFTVAGSTQRTFQVVKFPPMLKHRVSEAKTAEKKHKPLKRSSDDEWSLIRDSTAEKVSAPIKSVHPDELSDLWIDLLADASLASQESIRQQLDSSGAGKRLVQHGNSTGLVSFRYPPATMSEPLAALALSAASRPIFLSLEPYLGTLQTHAANIAQLACVGAAPLAVSHCLHLGDPDRYREVCDMAEIIRALSDGCREWKIPVIADAVSVLRGDRGGEGATRLPLAAISMIGSVLDARCSSDDCFKQEKQTLLLLGNSSHELGASEFQHYCQRGSNTDLPNIDFNVHFVHCTLLRELVQNGLLSTAIALGSGGLALALTRGCLSGSLPLGANLEIFHQTPKLRPEEYLFAETPSRFLVALRPTNRTAVFEACAAAGITIAGEGTTGGKSIQISGAAECEIATSTAFKVWKHRLEQVFSPEIAA